MMFIVNTAGHRNKARLVLAIAAASAALVQAQAIAQETGQVAEALEEITVTGSRIRQTSGFTTPVPVTSLSTSELFDFDPGNTISEQLDALPQFFDTGSPQRGDGGRAAVGSGGTAGLNIRNLNAGLVTRTLVLLDGARVVPTDKRGNVNIDLFPTALMRSVDVVTGGASAAYGADAVGGVVNFVLDREYEGLQVRASGGVQEEDLDQGRQWEVSIAGGRGFLADRLHLIGSFEAREIGEVQPDRDRLDSFRRIGFVTNPEWSPGAPPGVPQRLTLPYVAPADQSPTGLISGTGTQLDGMKFTRDGSGIEAFQLGEISSTGGPGSTRTVSGGREAEIYHQTADGGPAGAEAKTRSGLLGLQYEFSSTFSAYLQGMVGRTESNDLSSNAGFVATSIFAPRIAVDNAYLPEEVRQVMLANGLDQIQVNKTAAQFAGRPEIGSDVVGRNVFTQWQWSTGFDWDFAEGWNLHASWQQGESHRNSQELNLLQMDRFFLGMDAVRDPDSGEIVCRVNTYDPSPQQLAAAVEGELSSRPISPFVPAGVEGNTQPLTSPVEPESISTCMPYNFLGSGNMSQAVIDWVGTDRIKEGYVDQDFAEVIVTGDLLTLPAGPVGFAAGLTWRDQQFIDDAKPVARDLLGPPFNVPELGIRGIAPGFDGGSGNLNLFSTIPYIAGQTDVWEWFGEVNVPVFETAAGQRLVANGAFRQSDYDRSGKSDSWKVGLDFQAFNDLRLRATRSRDVREPVFSELFDRQGFGPTISDPRFGAETFLTTGIRGGNPDLAPETANTSVLGLVYQPTFVSWLNGLSVSVDWWDVEIDDAIAQLGAQRIVDECELGGVQSLCAQITRDAETQIITRVNDPFLNVAGASADGTDLELLWRAQPDFSAGQAESFSLRLLASYVRERTDTPRGGTARDVSGTVGNPDLSANVTSNYGFGPYSFQLQARYIDSVALNADWVEGVDVDDNSIPSMTWWNARISYNGEFNNGATWTAGLNIQNLFNQEPPVIPTQGTINNSYDAFGRRYNLNVNYRF